MIFLALFTWATLTTEPPVIIKPFRTLDECLAEAAEKNSGRPRHTEQQEVKYICLSARGET